MLCVRPGVLLVNANPFLPTRQLIRVDFPTLLLPKNAISGRPSEGNWSGLTELTTNSELIQEDRSKTLQRAVHETLFRAATAGGSGHSRITRNYQERTTIPGDPVPCSCLPNGL